VSLSRAAAQSSPPHLQRFGCLLQIFTGGRLKPLALGVGKCSHEMKAASTSEIENIWPQHRAPSGTAFDPRNAEATRLNSVHISQMLLECEDHLWSSWK
jgi:hypothetical protein